MVLVDKKILAGGILLISVGLAFLYDFSATAPVGSADMTPAQADELLARQQENRSYTNLAGMLAGIGFLLVLISFGARRKKEGSKPLEKDQKPKDL